MSSQKDQKKVEISVITTDPKADAKSAPKSSCHVNREMLPMKMHFLLFVSAVGVAYPYMVVFAKNRINISTTSLAVLLTAQQFLFILTKPLIGYIADYFNKLKAIILVLMVMQTALLFTLLAVPKIDTEKYTILPSDGTDVCAWYDACNPLKFKQYPIHKDENQSSIIIKPRDVCSLSSNDSITAPDYFEILHSVMNGTGDSFSIASSDEHHLLSLTEAKYSFSQCKHDSNKSCAYLTPTCFVCCDADSSFCNVASCTSEFNLSREKTTSETINDFQTYEFWSFAVTYSLSITCTNGLFTLSDTACCESATQHGADFGKQRLYGALGWGVAAVAGGYLNDYTGDYLVSWILMAIITFLALINMYKMELATPQFSQNILKDVGTVLANKEYLAFASMVFMCGMGTGIIWFYLVWFLTTIGGSKFLCGLSHAVQCAFGEVPFMFFSGWMIKKLGHFNIMTLALGSYCIRFFWYSHLYNPWLSLPVEILHGFTYGLFYPAVATYAKMSAKPGTEATTQAILFTMHEGLGAGMGCILTGIGIDKFGTHQTFFYASIVAGCGTVISVILHLLVRRKKTTTVGT